MYSTNKQTTLSMNKYLDLLATDDEFIKMLYQQTYDELTNSDFDQKLKVFADNLVIKHNQLNFENSNYHLHLDYVAPFQVFNIIVSKKLLNNFEKTLSCVQETQKSARLTVPVFVPTNRMRKYESIRADVSDCLEIAKISDRFGIDTLNLIKHCNEHTELAVKELICSGKYDYLKDKENSPKWVFVNVTRDLNVYYGNVGAHTEYIGNLKELSEAQLIDSICKLSSNYDYTSYFSDETFLKIDGLIHPVNADDKVYPSVPDCLYSLLDKAGVKNLII